MVKYDKKRAEFKDFEKLLQDIRECEDDSADSDFSYGNIEFSASETVSENSEDAVSEISEDTPVDLEYVPGKFYSLVANEKCISEDTEDFPKNHEDSEIQLTYEELRKLSIVDRKEYNDKKNIINPNKKPMKMKRRCKNIDD